MVLDGEVGGGAVGGQEADAPPSLPSRFPSESEIRDRFPLFLRPSLMDSPQQPRPYRSHRVPACDKCRQRKIRCKIEVPGRPCELCAERGFDCLFSATPTAQSTANHGTTSSGRPRKRPRLEAVSSPPISGPRRSHAGPRKNSSRRPAAESAQSTPLTEITGSALRHGSHGASNNVGESSIVVGPMVAEDVQILQQYLTAEPRADPQSREPYSVISNAPESPMIYLSVPRRREGSRLIKDPGHDQREILEQIIGPKKQDVIKLYFKHIHPAFPVLDEEPFTEADGSSISSALLCEVCAISLTFWYQSNTLRHHHCPSEQYFWNLAIAALQEDFLAPNLLTLYPSIVDLLGRPVGSVQGNVVNAGRTMALAHTLGLNRDPSAWRIPDRDKHRRKRLFWGCMVLDQWSSFAHGVPPSILRKQYDVPLPSISVLLTPENDSDERVKAAVCFIQLCTLSQLLGDVLPSVYDLGEPHKDMARELRRLECDLDEWEASLPEYLQVEAIENGTSVSGASSLRFGYLSVRMLLCRVSLRVASRDNAPDSNDIRQYHVTTLRRAATRIADFIISLQSCHLKEFWLSFTGHLIASAATILLRCAVDTADATVAEGCKDSLKSLQTRLHQAKNQDNWDLADMFIRRCDEPISRITAMSHSETRERTTAAQNIEERQRHTVSEGPADVSLSTYSEFTLPIDPLEYPWESLWDMLEGP